MDYKIKRYIGQTFVILLADFLICLIYDFKFVTMALGSMSILVAAFLGYKYMKTIITSLYRIGVLVSVMFVAINLGFAVGITLLFHWPFDSLYFIGISWLMFAVTASVVFAHIKWYGHHDTSNH